MAEIRIISAYTSPTFNVRLPGSMLDVNGKNNVEDSPDAKGDDIVEVQTSGYENPKMAIDNINITGSSGDITINNIYQLAKHKYTGSNPIQLRVAYGDSTNLVSFSDLTATDIPVVLNDWSIKFDATNSRNAYLPKATLTFEETK